MIDHIHRGTYALLSIVVCLIAGMVSFAGAGEPAGVNIPLVNKDGSAGLTAAPASGVDVSIEVIEGETSEETTTRLTFNNPHAERRIAALEGVPKSPIRSARALVFEYELTSQIAPFDPFSAKPYIVALFFECDGGAWYRLISKFKRDVPNRIRVPLRGAFSRARFAMDSDEAIRWEQIDRVWLGVVDDGPMAGTLEVRRARFTDEPFRPTSPVNIGRTWEVAQDPAVRSKLHLPDHAPWGASFEFEIPGGRHMYAMARTPVDVPELEAYSALRFYTDLNKLPEEIDGLLVMLIEADGTQYQAVPAPVASEELKEITIPFEQFQRGGWSKDENDQLDLEQVSHVAIGMHGTTPKTASGIICISSPQFVP